MIKKNYQTGLELNIKDNMVMDVYVTLFNIDSKFVKTHGVVTNRLF